MPTTVLKRELGVEANLLAHRQQPKTGRIEFLLAAYSCLHGQVVVVTGGV